MTAPINEDIAAIEAALANKPERLGFRTGIDGASDHACALRDWSGNIEATCDPARLRRVIDTMRAMGEALEQIADGCYPSGTCAQARAALAAYRGTKA